MVRDKANEVPRGVQMDQKDEHQDQQEYPEGAVCGKWLIIEVNSRTRLDILPRKEDHRENRNMPHIR